MPESKKCQSCMFYRKLNSLAFGQCLRTSPRGRDRFPYVGTDDWCGQYEASEPKGRCRTCSYWRHADMPMPCVDSGYCVREMATHVERHRVVAEFSMCDGDWSCRHWKGK